MNQRDCWNGRQMITGTLLSTTRISTVFCTVCTVCTTSKNTWKDNHSVDELSLKHGGTCLCCQQECPPVRRGRPPQPLPGTYIPLQAALYTHSHAPDSRRCPVPWFLAIFFPARVFCRKEKSHKLWSSVLRWLLFAVVMLVLQLHPMLELLPRWCESLMGFTVSSKLLHPQCPLAATPSAVSGMAPKPLTWMVSASLLELLWLVADVCRACGVELSARGVASSEGPAVVAAGASRPGSGHSYAHAGTSFAGDSLAECAHVDVSSGVPLLRTDDLRRVHGKEGVASCGAGILRLRRQARGRFLELVGVSDSLFMWRHARCTREFMEVLCTMHVNSYSLYTNSCVGVRRGTKPRSALVGCSANKLTRPFFEVQEEGRWARGITLTARESADYPSPTSGTPSPTLKGSLS